MKKFTISDLERFSGVKAHTLRAWEARYGIAKPERGRGNSRYYSLEDVENILGIALLNRNGYRISSLASLSSVQVSEKLRKLTDDDHKQHHAIVDMLVNMYSMNAENFDNVLSACMVNWPTHFVIQEVIYTFLKKIGLLWQGNKLPEEHLVVTILRKKIIYAIETVDSVKRQNKKALLFLTNNKQLDLALLYATYMLKRAGVEVIYMGYDVSIDNLTTVFQKINPDYLFTYLPCRNNFPFRQLDEAMNELVPHAKFVFTTQPYLKPMPFVSHKIMLMGFDEALSFISE